MNTIPIYIDTKNIIINLLNEDNKENLSIERLQNLLNYIYIELWKNEKLNDYQITFDVNYDIIERTVLYNRDLFAWDINKEIIYLRKINNINDLANDLNVGSTLLSIIKCFTEA